ncbi:MAG: HNH endonuclease [Candidatus Marinimicrobia bacterium]|nr:HNH endonuclease [Candidatus Neomarinimicrobiota bacterium]
MKAYEIIGGYAHICDMCKEDDGRPTLYWKKRDFDLCYPCIEKLYLDYVIDNIEENMYIGIKVIRKSISEELRNEIFKRDGYKCKKCGNKKDLTIDHVIPFSKGGTTERDNLQTLCQKCNRGKGAKN